VAKIDIQDLAASRSGPAVRINPTLAHIPGHDKGRSVVAPEMRKTESKTVTMSDLDREYLSLDWIAIGGSEVLQLIWTTARKAGSGRESFSEFSRRRDMVFTPDPGSGSGYMPDEELDPSERPEYRRKWGEESAAMGDIVADRAAPYESTRVALRGVGMSTNEAKMWQHVYVAAATFALPIRVVGYALAAMRYESNGNPQAQHPSSGARGLFQIKEKLARDYRDRGPATSALKLGWRDEPYSGNRRRVPNDKMDALFDPKLNARVMMWDIARSLDWRKTQGLPTEPTPMLVYQIIHDGAFSKEPSEYVRKTVIKMMSRAFDFSQTIAAAQVNVALIAG